MPGSYEFTQRHFKEISLLLDEDENLPPGEEGSEFLAEKFRNRLYYRENPSAHPDGKRFLFTANDPGAYNAVSPLIRSLENNPDCKGIAALVSGTAGKTFKKEHGADFPEVADKNQTLIQGILEFSRQKPLDAIITTGSSFHGPESLALFGKMDAKKIFVVIDGWGDSAGPHFDSGNLERMNDISGILCVDETEKSLLLRVYQEKISPDKFLVTGSPAIDDLKVERPEDFARRAREKFGLSPDTIAVTYFGTRSDELQTYYGCDGLINEKTFAQILDGLLNVAAKNPEKKFSLLVRPHPRDPNKQELFSLVQKTTLPDNLKILATGDDKYSKEEVRYASDVVTSVAGTEIFFGSRLGRAAVFLGFEQGNLGDTVLTKKYGQKMMKELPEADPNIHIVDSPENFEKLLENSKRAEPDFNSLPLYQQKVSATKRIEDIILAD